MVSQARASVTKLRLNSLFLLAALSLAACRSASDDVPYWSIAHRAIPKIEAQMGLTFKTPPVIESRTSAEVGEFVMHQLSSPRATAQLEGQQSVYRILGLIPDTLDLQKLLQQLLEEQIVGYYDPATKVLYVVEGAREDLLEQTVVHELVHALQDQYVAIDSIQAGVDDSDRQVAAQAVLEGQAVFEQLRADKSTGAILKMPGGWDRVRDLIRDGQGSMPVFASAPRIVRESLLFPYLGGADFVRRFLNVRTPAELLTDLPVSTKQILNDSAYFGAVRDEPTPVTLPKPLTGTVHFTNTFGEFETRLILSQHVSDGAVARRASTGIDGDRYAVIRTFAGDALVWASVWDSAVDAADFLNVVTDALRKRYDLGRVAGESGNESRVFRVPERGSHAARNVAIHLTRVDGRPVVTVIDAPLRAGNVMDHTRITLSN